MQEDAAVTAPDLDALARETIALGERATKGPWLVPEPDTAAMTCVYTESTNVALLLRRDDAALLAAYRTSAPALATALLEAREAMREVLAMLGEPLHWHERVEKAAARLESALRSGADEKETT